MLLSLLFSAVGKEKTVPYDPAAFQTDIPAYVIEGEVRVELLRDTLVRIETKGPRGFENRPSFTVEKRTGWDTVAFSTEKENGYTVIRTAAYNVYVPVGAASSPLPRRLLVTVRLPVLRVFVKAASASAFSTPDAFVLVIRNSLSVALNKMV